MYPYNYPKGEISMLNQNYTAKLLNLEDVIITNVENIFEELHIYVTQFNVIEEAKKRGFDM